MTWQYRHQIYLGISWWWLRLSVHCPHTAQHLSSHSTSSWIISPCNNNENNSFHQSLSSAGCLQVLTLHAHTISHTVSLEAHPSSNISRWFECLSWVLKHKSRTRANLEARGEINEKVWSETWRLFSGVLSIQLEEVVLSVLLLAWANKSKVPIENKSRRCALI